MNKKIIVAVLSVLVLGGVFFVISSNKKDEESVITSPDISLEEKSLDSPDRPAEINGTVISVEGNIVVVANEIGKELLSEEDRVARQEEMKNLSPEERQALRQQELENTETKDVEVTIPVGVTISKGSGDASGNNVSAEISELVKGTYISIWVSDSNTPEFVKIKGLGQ